LGRDSPDESEEAFSLAAVLAITGLAGPAGAAVSTAAVLTTYGDVAAAMYDDALTTGKRL
jgi:uncharacterized iron-regulated protein